MSAMHNTLRFDHWCYQQALQSSTVGGGGCMSPGGHQWALLPRTQTLIFLEILRWSWSLGLIGHLFEPSTQPIGGRVAEMQASLSPQ